MGNLGKILSCLDHIELVVFRLQTQPVQPLPAQAHEKAYQVLCRVREVLEFFQLPFALVNEVRKGPEEPLLRRELSILVLLQTLQEFYC